MTRSLILAMLLLAACSDKPAGDTVGKEIADDYQQSLDKARAVEEQAQDAKDRVDAALEEADGGGAD
jgi:hypothetical protein